MLERLREWRIDDDELERLPLQAGFERSRATRPEIGAQLLTAR